MDTVALVRAAVGFLRPDLPPNLPVDVLYVVARDLLWTMTGGVVGS